MQNVLIRIALQQPRLLFVGLILLTLFLRGRYEYLVNDLEINHYVSIAIIAAIVCAIGALFYRYPKLLMWLIVSIVLINILMMMRSLVFLPLSH